MLASNVKSRKLGDIEAATKHPSRMKREVHDIRKAKKQMFRAQNIKNEKLNNQNDKSDVSSVLCGRLRDLPSEQSNIVQIFISSTFSDFKVERNAIFRDAYPVLKKFCSERGLEFSIADMRWGINEDSVNQHAAVNMCLREIQRCQQYSSGPNFVYLCGNRYGYRPIPSEIEAEEFNAIANLAKKICPDKAYLLGDWYLEDENSIPPTFVLQPINSRIPGFGDYSKESSHKKARKQWAEIEEELRVVLWRTVDTACELGSLSMDRRSEYEIGVTELEVRHGLLTAPNPLKTCCAYLRDLEGLKDAPVDDYSSRYQDVVQSENRLLANQISRKLLESLRTRVSQVMSQDGALANFSLQYTKPLELSQQYVSEFTSHFTHDISELINNRINEWKESKDSEMFQSPLFIEALHHATFAKNKCRMFCGRVTELSLIRTWIIDPRMQQPIIVHGPPGSGKTSILAQTCNVAEQWLGDQSVVVVRFLGTSANSSSIYTTILSICQQLSAVYRIPLNEQKLDSMKNICRYFPQILKTVSMKGGRNRPLLIILDSIDQLLPTERAYSLQWLPLHLPAYVSILISTLSDFGDILGNAKQLLPDAPGFLDIPKLDKEACREIAVAYLSNRKRSLTHHQLEFLLARLENENTPLYLRVLIEEAASWSSYTAVDSSMIGNELKESINLFFNKLESRHGVLLVKAALGYLTIGLNGVSIVELEDLLSCDDDVLNEIFCFHDPPVDGVVRIPPLLCARLFADLEDYLAETSMDGRRTMRWYHGIFQSIAFERYASPRAAFEKLNSNLAELFLADKPIIRDLSLMNHKRQIVIKNANRLIAVQPLDSNAPRKLRCTWYHLAHAGRTEDLKETVICNLTFIKAYINAFSYQETIEMMNNCLRILQAQDEQALAEIVAFRDCLLYSREIVEKDMRALPIQVLGQLKGIKDKDGVLFPQINKLCQQCRDSEDKNIYYTLAPLFSCFPSSQGSLKWYMEEVYCVFDTSANGVYMLIYTGSIRQTRHLKVIDLETISVASSIDLSEEPTDCRFNRAMTCVYVLTKENLLLFDLIDGKLVVEYPTLIGRKYTLNTCFDFDDDDIDIALAGEDRIAIIYNRGYKNGLDKYAFEWDRTLVVRTAMKTAAIRFVQNEKLSMLVSVHVSRLDNELLIRVFNHESKEVIGSMELGTLPNQQALPCSSRNLVQTNSSHVLLAMNDGAMYLIDILSSTVVWTHEEVFNPDYLRTVKPHLRFSSVDQRRRQALFVISYGEFTWLRIFDFDKNDFVFSQRSNKQIQTISSACVLSTADDSEGLKVVLGGRSGDVEMMQRSDVDIETQDAFSEGDEEKEKRRTVDTSFRGHLRPVKSVYFRNGFLISLADDRLLKVWKVDQIACDRNLHSFDNNKDLEYENISSLTLTIDGHYVITASGVIKQWRIIDGVLERSIALQRTTKDEENEPINDPNSVSLIDDDKYLVCESKEKNILIIANFLSGEIIKSIPRPTVWTRSTQKPLIYTVTMREDSNFIFQMIKLPNMDALLRKEFQAPHPGIEEAVRGLTPSKYEDYIVIHWGQKSSATFEAWVLSLIDMNSPLTLVGCRDKTEKMTRAWRKQQNDFKQVYCLLPLTHEAFILGATGDLPVWDLKSEECAIPFTPYMEAWLKHSVSINLCKPNVKPPGRKGYDEKQFPKSPITAIAASIDAGLVVSGARDGSIILWRYSDVGRIREYDIQKSWGCRVIIKNAHEAEVTCLTLSPRENLLLSGSEDKHLCMFSVKTGRLLSRVFTHMTVREVEVTPDTQFVMAVCRNLAEQRLMLFAISGSTSE